MRQVEWFIYTTDLTLFTVLKQGRPAKTDFVTREPGEELES